MRDSASVKPDTRPSHHTAECCSSEACSRQSSADGYWLAICDMALLTSPCQLTLPILSL